MHQTNLGLSMIQQLKDGEEAQLQWENTCLACQRSQVAFPALPVKDLQWTMMIVPETLQSRCISEQMTLIEKYLNN